MSLENLLDVCQVAEVQIGFGFSVSWNLYANSICQLKMSNIVLGKRKYS